MGNLSVVIPCSVLGAICVCMLVFICWWFPRTWAKGTAEDIQEFEGRRQQQRDLELATSDGDGDSTAGDARGTGVGSNNMTTVPQVRAYVPPPVTSY